MANESSLPHLSSATSAAETRVAETRVLWQEALKSLNAAQSAAAFIGASPQFVFWLSLSHLSFVVLKPKQRKIRRLRL